MEQISITIQWGTAGHTFSVPGEVAGAWLAGNGISPSDPEAALREAAVRIVEPIVGQGLQMLHDQEKAALLAAVRGA